MAIKRLIKNPVNTGMIKNTLCYNCNKELIGEFILGVPVWRKKGRTVHYYCDHCKRELFEGVKTYAIYET